LIVIQDTIWNTVLRTSFFAYSFCVLISYFILSGNPILREFAPRELNFVMLHMINLVPFRNILNWIINRDNFNPDIVFRNLVLSTIIWIPAGVFSFCMFKQTSPLKKYVYFVAIISVLFLSRVLIFIGYYDIDKIILASLAYFIAYYTCFSMSKARKYVI